MKNIALFGGSFDPPHLGHIEVIEEALRSLNIDKLIVVPAYLNPFKTRSAAPASLRYKWLQQIFKDHQNVEVNDFEIRQNRSVTTIETVRHFLNTEPCRIFLIIGADNLPTLKKWHQYEELKLLVTFVVARRDGIAIPDEYINLHVNSPISSTALRNSMNHILIPQSVRDDINTFYKDTNGTNHRTKS